MGKINVLDKSVYNLIAAGEVVDKPASIVKELVENSIDAGANNIFVEIVNGGIDKICVTDNGCGISFDDCEKAFMPHATSKVKVAEDLEKIGTLGFRGEALASISAVSNVKLLSKQENEEMGTVFEISFNEIKNHNQTASPNGTIISVENMFENLPARAKFLRKPKTEQTDITNLMAKFILSNPNIKFKYVADNETIFQTNGESLEEAIFQIYGNETLINLIKVSKQFNGLNISGYVSKPTFSKANRTYQSLFVNGRYVNNFMISNAVSNAFENYLMKGKFPMYVLKLEMPLNNLDVNVHPNKMEVKFSNSNFIYGCIYSAITEAIMQSTTFEAESKVENLNPKLNEFFEGKSFENKPEEIKEQKPVERIINYMPAKENVFKSSNDIFSKMMNNRLNEQLEKKATEQIKMENLQENLQTKVEINSNDIVLISKLFNTFLLAQVNDKYYLIDQHAAHERLNYDRLTKEVESKNVLSQTLLIPEIINVNSLEQSFIEAHLANLKNLGFEFEAFGKNTFKVSSMPMSLNIKYPQEFLQTFLSEINTLKNFDKVEIIDEKLKQIACKSSVKGGDDLSKNEIDLLISKITAENNVLLCPHGRPIMIELTRAFLDKLFKRIV